MAMLSELKTGDLLHDSRTGRDLPVDRIEIYGQVVFLSFKHPGTGAIDRQPFTVVEAEERFQVIKERAVLSRADPQIVTLVAEASRLQHAYLFNPLFATETSLIDLLPHQLAAVYGAPATPADPGGRPGMVDMPRLRFMLADDAGAGKTIMAGLLIRELLLRRSARRVLVVPPAGMVGNWERELRILFRLRFRTLSGALFNDDYNPFADPRNDLAIISMDTLWRDKARKACFDATPYDLVIFDEAHKLSARREADLTLDRTNRYQVAELIARQRRHLLLLTATPHMGKDDPYYLLWRLLEPELLSTPEAFERQTAQERQRHLLRRMKEEMVRFDGSAIFPPRTSETPSYPLTQGPGQEQDLYDQVTLYCQTHFDRAKLRNRSAAGLAMSILQRRLASSTWAMLKSLERREEKLAQLLKDMEAGMVGEDDLEARQRGLPAKDVRDEKTGDEEEIDDDQEEAERQDSAAAGATDARTVAELRIELAEVRRLAALARHVYDQRNESKFERLWQALEQHPNEKVLIFTEFRDTLDFLVGRLEGKGLAGKIAAIHGGMPYPKRDAQAAFFQDEHGARIMVATDAAGEGINLQFCWLLINYDIPWNPARLEQRMGRVHRYKQRHPVLLLNVISENTREGRVLKVLLDKLEAIRKQLGDKVFDIIGQQFSGKPLVELIFEAVVEGKEREATQEIERSLDLDQVQDRLAAQARKVEVSEVRALLHGLQAQREAAAQRRMMPAYVRRFFDLVAPHVGVGLRGSVEERFWLDPCPASVQQALAGYPEAIRQRLTFDRALAMPDLAREPEAIYLHPGEPVFDAVTALFLAQRDHEGMRGAVFLDPAAAAPSVFYLAKAVVLREAEPPETRGVSETPRVSESEIVDETMTGIRRHPDGRCELAPAHALLTFYPAKPEETDFRSLGDFGNLETAPVEAFAIQAVGQPALERCRGDEEQRLPQRVEQLRVATNLRMGELAQQRKLLKDAVERGVPAAASKLRNCLEELAGLDRQRRQAEAALYGAVDRLRLGPVSLYVQALVLPIPPEELERRQEVHAEEAALAEVKRREEAEGSSWEDVSDPHRKAGFDLKVTRADGSVRYVEVKGRSGRQAVELTENEWAQAANHRDRYWLYTVYNCDTAPEFYAVADPFGRLLAKQTGAIRIAASQIIAAAQAQRDLL